MPEPETLILTVVLIPFTIWMLDWVLDTRGRIKASKKALHSRRFSL